MNHDFNPQWVVAPDGMYEVHNPIDATRLLHLLDDPDKEASARRAGWNVDEMRRTCLAVLAAANKPDLR